MDGFYLTWTYETALYESWHDVREDLIQISVIWLLFFELSFFILYYISYTVFCKSKLICTSQAELFGGLEAALGSPFGSEPLNPPPNPLIIVISGPSGVGKDSVIKVLYLQLLFLRYISHRTKRNIFPNITL